MPFLSAPAKPQKNPTYQLTLHGLRKQEGAEAEVGQTPVLPLIGSVSSSDITFLIPSFLTSKMGETRSVTTVKGDLTQKRHWGKTLK